jgi:membrane protein DedA with SNARE-associated domain
MEILHGLIDFFSNYGYIAVFIVLLACGFGLPIPEDITLVAGGVICGFFPEQLHIYPMLAVALAGVIIGDSTMFLLGRFLGPNVKKVPLLKFVFTPRNYKKIQDKIHKYGTWILFIARFLPGLRAPIFVSVGISRKASYFKFLLLDGSAALISVPLWVLAGYHFSSDLDKLVHMVKSSEKVIISAVVICVILYVVYNIWKCKKKSK